MQRHECEHGVGVASGGYLIGTLVRMGLTDHQIGEFFSTGWRFSAFLAQVVRDSDEDSPQGFARFAGWPQAKSDRRVRAFQAWLFDLADVGVAVMPDDFAEWKREA